MNEKFFIIIRSFFFRFMLILYILFYYLKFCNWFFIYKYILFIVYLFLYRNECCYSLVVMIMIIKWFDIFFIFFEWKLGYCIF